MRLEELLEALSGPSMTSVSSIGRVYYNSFTNHIKLYKQVDNGYVPVAKIQRAKGRGWNFKTFGGWTQLNLPHFGNANNTNIKGIKTHTNSLEDILKQWGIRYDSLESLRDSG